MSAARELPLDTLSAHCSSHNTSHHNTCCAHLVCDHCFTSVGINIPENLFENNTADEWEKISAVNLRGPINLSRTALPYLKESAHGRIINAASIGGHVGLHSNVLYTMTKGAMMLFTKSLAAELATTRVTVNSISPGMCSIMRCPLHPPDVHVCIHLL